MIIDVRAARPGDGLRARRTRPRHDRQALTTHQVIMVIGRIAEHVAWLSIDGHLSQHLQALKHVKRAMHRAMFIDAR